ncbi:MAG TPA: hypothetical protein VIC28_10070 [Thermoanaerobaculia bacterium]
MNKLFRPQTLGLLSILLLFAAAGFGQPLPSPASWARNLDVRCYKITGPAPGINLRLDHLNPALVAMGMPFENVILGQPQDLCVPVSKGTIVPPPDVLPFIKFLDWKCYGITGPALNLSLALNQLNPIIQGLLGPTLNVIVREPQQLCVPVQKNGSVPPPAVLNLVKWLDVKCYRVESSQDPSGKTVMLTHLNPLITRPPETVTFLAPPNPIQLCVPVKKNLVSPPTTVLPLAQFSDVLCYKINGVALDQFFQLKHQNPVLAGLPIENVTAGISDKLCVPVAKNGFFPPP